jgi:CDP-ribitol ribitolphosphotransferase
MKKKLGYWLFAACFGIFRICRVQKDKVFFVATHDDSDEGNVGIVAEAIRNQMPEKKLYFLTRRDGIRHPFEFFIKKAFHMATAGIIFMDNHFLPMAYTPISKKTKVVQLWHGTGTIKKFGLDVETGEVAKMAARANERTTHLIVNGERTKKQYATAFGMSEEKIYILGLPRTDRMLDEAWMESRRQKFYEQFSELRGKRCILYAPTFRDEEVENPQIALNLQDMAEHLEENEVLLLRLHPHVAANLKTVDWAAFHGKIRNFSGFAGVTTLLAVADCLVTDYSSIVFEYSLRGKPVCFYAYDLEQFEKTGRNFYEKYESFVPGPIVRTQQELVGFLRNPNPDLSKIRRFAEENYAYLDRNAVQRLLQLIFE